MVCFSRRSWRVSIRRSRDSSIQRANLRASIRVTISSSIGASRIRQHLRHMRPQIWKTGERSTPQMIRISYIPLFSTFRQASPFLFRGRILRFLSNYRESYPMVLYHVSTASVQSFHSFVNCWPLIHNIRVFRVNNDMLTEESIFAEKLQKLTRTCYSEAQDPPTNALFWRLVLARSGEPASCGTGAKRLRRFGGNTGEFVGETCRFRMTCQMKDRKGAGYGPGMEDKRRHKRQAEGLRPGLY